MNDLCFCGSKKPYTECHGYIHADSFVAELYRLQKDLDSEMEIQNEKFSYDRYCCSRCLCVSEIEFVQILDYIEHSQTPDEREAVIQKSKQQWDILQEKIPETAHTLRSKVSFYDLIQLKNQLLPFPCIFWDESSGCSVYPVRPLVCRIPCSGSNEEKPCGRHCLLQSDDCDIQKYKHQMYSLLFYPWQNQLVIRRPAPLFYFFQLIFPDGYRPISDMEYVEKIMKLNRNEYIRWLVHTGKAKV